MSLPITTALIGVLTLIQVLLTVRIGLRRMQTGVDLLHGDDETLLRRMRGHGNYIETVPIALLAMGAAEYAGAPTSALLTGAAIFCVGRLLHYFSLVELRWGAGRAVGMFLTAAGMVVLAALCLAAKAGGWGDAHGL